MLSAHCHTKYNPHQTRHSTQTLHRTTIVWDTFLYLERNLPAERTANVKSRRPEKVSQIHLPLTA